MFEAILILAVRRNRTRTVFSRNAKTSLHHCKTYLVFMHNMYPVAKSVKYGALTLAWIHSNLRACILLCVFKPRTLLVPDRQ
jgi:hypothetical protein